MCVIIAGDWSSVSFLWTVINWLVIVWTSHPGGSNHFYLTTQTALLAEILADMSKRAASHLNVSLTWDSLPGDVCRNAARNSWDRRLSYICSSKLRVTLQSLRSNITLPIFETGSTITRPPPAGSTGVIWGARALLIRSTKSWISVITAGRSRVRLAMKTNKSFGVRIEPWLWKYCHTKSFNNWRVGDSPSCFFVPAENCTVFFVVRFLFCRGETAVETNFLLLRKFVLSGLLVGKLIILVVQLWEIVKVVCWVAQAMIPQEYCIGLMVDHYARKVWWNGVWMNEYSAVW